MKLPLRILLLPALLTSCDTLTTWFPPPPPKVLTRVHERHTARLIALNKCPVADRDEIPLLHFVPPVLALAIPIIIDIGVKAFAQAAEQAKQNLSATYIAYGTMLVRGQKAPPGCLILARGTFGSDSAATAESRGMITPEVLESIGATSQPSLYIEIRVKSIKVEGGKDAYVFRPVFLQFNDTAASNPGNGEKNVGVMLSFARAPLSTLQTAEDVRKASEYFLPFNFGKIKRGTYLLADDTKAMPDTNEQPIKQQDVFFELIRIVPAEEAGARLVASLNTYALVTESGDPTLFDRAVNQIVSDKAFSDAAKKLAGSLFPQGNKP